LKQPLSLANGLAMAGNVVPSALATIGSVAMVENLVRGRLLAAPAEKSVDALLARINAMGSGPAHTRGRHSSGRLR